MDDSTMTDLALVTGKARKYLRTSTVLFLLSLLLAGSFLMVVERQYLQNRADFTDNVNVHLIKVTGPSLRFADLAKLQDTVRAERPGAAFDVAMEYSLGFGIPDTAGTPRFIYGIDGNAARLLGLPAMGSGVAYSMTPVDSRRITLQIPIVEIEAGGMSSGRTTMKTLALSGGVSRDTPLGVLGQPDANALYVDGATFRSIVEAAYETTWARFQSQYDKENVFGTEVVRNAYVHLADLEDVKPVAEAVTAKGYATSYTLKAFDDLADSLNTTLLIGLITVLIACLGCFAYIVLSFNSYLNVSHKDMAILRHFGFDARRLGQIYAHRARSLLQLIALVATGYLVVGGLLFLPTDRLRFALINVAVCLALSVALYLVLRLIVIPRHVRLSVLTLLKADKEFE
ncbi:hypothetical protein [Kribbella deserti]|uniref:FtsX-like permease family protein n=1 Tax=Kribbella deserti TaxID=1926257 RepID=A0ABV6QVA9_9ACTN